MDKVIDKEKNLIIDLLDLTYHIQTVILKPNIENLGVPHSKMFKRLFSMFDFDYSKLNELLSQMDEHTLYFFYERYELNFCILKFPLENEFFFVGPYLSKEISEGFIQELLLSQSQLRSTFINLKTFYQQLAVVDDKSITSFMNKIAQYCYGGINNYKVKRIHKYLLVESIKNEMIDIEPHIPNPESIKFIEERYQIENRLLKAVSTGNKRLAIEYLGRFELRMDSVYEENLKEHRNRLVIFNTLLRKSVEDSSVSPFYIDKLSRGIAKEIANIKSLVEADNLRIHIVRAYCDLVKQYSLPNYSPLIRDTINLINIYSNKKFELHELASELNINPSYLSQIFKRDTGETITSYITKQKITLAKKLLTESNYLIQEIAASIGIYDVNYFSKLFKKNTGLTPRDYRKKYQFFPLN